MLALRHNSFTSFHKSLGEDDGPKVGGRSAAKSRIGSLSDSVRDAKISQRHSVKTKIAVPKTMEMIMANAAVSILKKIGHDAVTIGNYLLTDAVKYLPVAETLASLIFPPAVAPLAEANAAADLLQKSVAAAEIQLASAGLKGDVGQQKLAMVLTIVTGAVTTLLGRATITADLAKAGITVNTAYVTSLVNAVVSLLNVKGVVSTAAAPPNVTASA